MRAHPHFIPSTDAGLLAYTSNFSDQLTLDPEAVGATAAMATSYAAKFATYQAGLANAVAPQSRGPATILVKNQNRAILVETTRQYARMFQGYVGTTDEKRQAFGLPIRKTHRTPIPAPTVSPRLTIVSVNGRDLIVQVSDGSSKRHKPAGVEKVTVVSYVGTSPPDETGSWKTEGTTGKTQFEVNFSPTLAPGATVWLAAYWSNPAGQSGPACTPVSYTFGAANLNNNGSLKLAA